MTISSERLGSLIDKQSKIQNKGIVINSLLLFVGVVGLIVMQYESLRLVGYGLVLLMIGLYFFFRLKFGLSEASFSAKIISNIFFGGRFSSSTEKNLRIGVIIDLVLVIVVLIFFWTIKKIA